MNCTEAQDRLQQRLDGEAAEDRAALDRHLAQCADCRALHAAAGVLEVGLRRLPSVVPPARLQKALVSSVLAERHARLRRQRRWRSVAALAAALLLSVGIGLYVTGPEQANRFFAGWFAPTPPTPAPLATTPVTEATPPEAPSIRDGVAGAGTAVVSLTLRTTEETVEQTRLLTGTLPSPPLNLLEALPPPQDQSPLAVWQETGQRVTSSFEPVTSSAWRAFRMFVRETVPAPVN